MARIHDASLFWGLANDERGRNAGWPERYRPQNLEETALDASVRRQITWYLRSEALPHHLIFHGPPATGKTTLANIIAQTFFPELHAEHVLRVGGSETRSVEFLRDHVMPCVRSCGGVFRGLEEYWRSMVIFSEADGLTPQAQAVLNDAMDVYAARTAFVFTTNSLDKLSAPIRSRCQIIEMQPPPFEERLRILNGVLAREGIDADRLGSAKLAASYDDMRELLRAAQNKSRKSSKSRKGSNARKSRNQKLTRGATR